LACASCRDALAAIVAALYNCIVSIPPLEKFQAGEPFATRVTLDRLLVCTLLRQLLPATSVSAAAAASRNDSNVDDDNNNNGDEATEWIVQTVEKLGQLGLLPQLYNSAAASGKNTVTPEFIVLLHCVARVVVHENADDTRTSNKPFLVGRHAGDTAIVSSHVFIANQFCLINTVLSSSNETDDERTSIESSSFVVRVYCYCLKHSIFLLLKLRRFAKRRNVRMAHRRLLTPFQGALIHLLLIGIPRSAIWFPSCL
jgi:hypothetical protein